jgi:hypothetical protein
MRNSDHYWRKVAAVFIGFLFAFVAIREHAVIASGIQALATVSAGGTGLTTLTAHALLIGNGALPVNFPALGTAGQCLASNGAAADPTFQACLGSGSINAGTINQTAFYAAAGTAISGVGPGTAGQCYESNGVGAAPSFQACGGSGGITLVEQHTASASATLDFTTCISGTYDDYIFKLLNVTPATAAQALNFLVGTGAGPTYDTSNNYYTGVNYVPNTGNSGTLQTSNVAQMQLFTAIDNTLSSGGLSGEIKMYNPQSSTIRKQFNWHVTGNQTLAVYEASGSGTWGLTTTLTAIRFLFASGNVATGTIRCYGVSK